MSTPATQAVAPYHDRERWLEARQSRIGSSDVAAILGADDFVTPQEIWDRVVLGERKETDAGDLRRGRKQEHIAVEAFCEDYGLTLPQVRRHPMREHPVHPWMVTDVDRMIVTLEKWPDGLLELMDEPRPGPGALEVKVPRVSNWFRFRDEGLPLSHVVQHQHHFLVTGWQWGVFAFYTPEYDELIAFPVLRDEQFCGLMERRLELWYRAHVIGRRRPMRTMPPPARWPAKPPGRATTRDDEAWLLAADTYAAARTESERARMELEAAESDLVKLLGENDQHVVGGGVAVKRYSTASQRRLDAKAFVAAVRLAQDEKDSDALLALDPNDDHFYFQTATSEKIDIRVIARPRTVEDDERDTSHA